MGTLRVYVPHCVVQQPALGSKPVFLPSGSPDSIIFVAAERWENVYCPGLTVRWPSVPGGHCTFLIAFMAAVRSEKEHAMTPLIRAALYSGGSGGETPVAFSSRVASDTG